MRYNNGMLVPFHHFPASLLPYQKRMPLDIVNGDAVLVSIHFVTPQNACISREPCPRFFNIVSLQTHSNGYTLALLGPLMQFHLSDYFPMCMRQETVEKFYPLIRILGPSTTPVALFLGTTSTLLR